jgi:hypothetical protein
MHHVLKGVIAGAAGTAALNIVTYLDMAIRARPASELPAKMAGNLADKANVSLGDEESATNRTQGLGPLLGYMTGIGWGLAYGALADGLRRLGVRLPWPAAAIGLGAAVMAGSDVPLVAQGLTDPKAWGMSGWLADAIPHLAYGAATAVTYDFIADAG